jgi:hypothetical protein
MTPSIWNFDTDTGDAYNNTQWREDIKDGDLLFVRTSTEQVIGFLFEAWPIAVTAERGEFHGIKPQNKAEWLAKFPSHAESFEMAESWARGYGLVLQSDLPAEV